MKKIGILTIYDLGNIGNRLQNYAIQSYIEDTFGYKCYLIYNVFYNNKSILKRININIKLFLKQIIPFFVSKRTKAFISFDKLINKDATFNKLKVKHKYDYFIVGSDQVWNPNFAINMDNRFAEFSSNLKKIAFAPSLGVSNLTLEQKRIFKSKLSDFDKISCREKDGAKIIEEIIGRKVPVLLDPTFMLSREKWTSIERKPKKMICDNYILLYCLGEITSEYEMLIDQISQQKKLKIINILDKNSKPNGIGPSEFLYLIRKASIILTDSFHACVFSIIYEKPFVVFERKDNNVSMNSRIESLFDILNLDSNHKYDKKINLDSYFNCDYSNTKLLIKRKQMDAYVFLKTSLSC